MGRAIVAGGAEATKPITGILLSDIAEGSIVKLNENGSPVEFYVACHDYESTLNGTGRTLLVRKDNYGTTCMWNSASRNVYKNSTVDTWLNDTYKNVLDSSVIEAIGTTTFKYTPMNGNTAIGTLIRSVFILSAKELGMTSSSMNYEGSTLPISNLLKIAYKDGSANSQGTRSPDTSTNYAFFYLDSTGTLKYLNASSSLYPRPCFTLPSASLFDKNTLLFKGVA